ncbi:hypothetical protein BIW11_03271 [Tropilaelaps mercedesae]|uniref:Uncharacterized protein n=1 Tax=Tropilaelaps mercedesae TaxID=418985 RepID=A0A1V9XPP0_9ACAR|nr:hypothetical protein BIW11_03271 [Tropilaelaps mercedesae]
MPGTAVLNDEIRVVGTALTVIGSILQDIVQQEMTVAEMSKRLEKTSRDSMPIDMSLQFPAPTPSDIEPEEETRIRIILEAAVPFIEDTEFSRICETVANDSGFKPSDMRLAAVYEPNVLVSFRVLCTQVIEANYVAHLVWFMGPMHISLIRPYYHVLYGLVMQDFCKLLSSRTDVKVEDELRKLHAVPPELNYTRDFRGVEARVHRRLLIDLMNQQSWVKASEICADHFIEGSLEEQIRILCSLPGMSVIDGWVMYHRTTGRVYATVLSKMLNWFREMHLEDVPIMYTPVPAGVLHYYLPADPEERNVQLLKDRLHQQSCLINLIRSRPRIKTGDVDKEFGQQYRTFLMLQQYTNKYLSQHPEFIVDEGRVYHVSWVKLASSADIDEPELPIHPQGPSAITPTGVTGETDILPMASTPVQIGAGLSWSCDETMKDEQNILSILRSREWMAAVKFLEEYHRQFGVHKTMAGLNYVKYLAHICDGLSLDSVEMLSNCLWETNSSANRGSPWGLFGSCHGSQEASIHVRVSQIRGVQLTCTSPFYRRQNLRDCVKDMLVLDELKPLLRVQRKLLLYLMHEKRWKRVDEAFHQATMYLPPDRDELVDLYLKIPGVAVLDNRVKFFGWCSRVTQKRLTRLVFWFRLIPIGDVPNLYLQVFGMMLNLEGDRLRALLQEFSALEDFELPSNCDEREEKLLSDCASQLRRLRALVAQSDSITVDDLEKQFKDKYRTFIMSGTLGKSLKSYLELYDEFNIKNNLVKLNGIFNDGGNDPWAGTSEKRLPTSVYEEPIIIKLSPDSEDQQRVAKNIRALLQSHLDSMEVETFLTSYREQYGELHFGERLQPYLEEMGFRTYGHADAFLALLQQTPEIKHSAKLGTSSDSFRHARRRLQLRSAQLLRAVLWPGAESGKWADPPKEKNYPLFLVNHDRSPATSGPKESVWAEFPIEFLTRFRATLIYPYLLEDYLSILNFVRLFNGRVVFVHHTERNSIAAVGISSTPDLTVIFRDNAESLNSPNDVHYDRIVALLKPEKLLLIREVWEKYMETNKQIPQPAQGSEISRTSADTAESGGQVPSPLGQGSYTVDTNLQMFHVRPDSPGFFYNDKSTVTLASSYGARKLLLANSNRHCETLLIFCKLRDSVGNMDNVTITRDDIVYFGQLASGCVEQSHRLALELKGLLKPARSIARYKGHLGSALKSAKVLVARGLVFSASKKGTNENQPQAVQSAIELAKLKSIVVGLLKSTSGCVVESDLEGKFLAKVNNISYTGLEVSFKLRLQQASAEESSCVGTTDLDSDAAGALRGQLMEVPFSSGCMEYPTELQARFHDFVGQDLVIANEDLFLSLGRVYVSHHQGLNGKDVGTITSGTPDKEDDEIEVAREELDIWNLRILRLQEIGVVSDYVKEARLEAHHVHREHRMLSKYIDALMRRS